MCTAPQDCRPPFQPSKPQNAFFSLPESRPCPPGLLLETLWHRSESFIVSKARRDTQAPFSQSAINLLPLRKEAPAKVPFGSPLLLPVWERPRTPDQPDTPAVRSRLKIPHPAHYLSVKTPAFKRTRTPSVRAASCPVCPADHASEFPHSNTSAVSACTAPPIFSDSPASDTAATVR